MAQTFIWKPSTINSWKGGIAFLADSAGPRQTPIATLPDGRKIEGKYVNTNEGRHQWTFPSELAGVQGIKIDYAGQTGTVGNGAISYEGGSLGNWAERQKGSLGAPGSSGVPGQFTPGNIGFGAVPAYLGGAFPSPFLAEYNPIDTAPYTFTDPQKFAETFGKFNREEALKNYDLSKEISLKTLDTELEALQDFIPAASALKRGEIAIDNQFNQQQRTQQVDSVLPNARGDLAAQRDRAVALASGRLPSSVEDRAFEVAGRSRTADQVAAGGFGLFSGIARKASELMSAEDRLKLSQMGDQLLTGNLQTSSNLLLAPTEYSNAGSQVQVNPTVSPSQLITQNAGRLDALTTISPTTGLQTTVQQNQYTTGLEQQTRQFNAGNQLQLSQFNTGIQNSFALQKFGYDVSYAGAAAGAAQLNTNTQLALEQQQQAMQITQDIIKQGQNIQQIQSIIQGIGALIGGSGGIGGLLGGITNLIGGLFGGGGGAAGGLGDVGGLIPGIGDIDFSPGGFLTGGVNVNANTGAIGGQAVGTIFGGPAGGQIGQQVGAQLGEILGPYIQSLKESFSDFFGGSLDSIGDSVGDTFSDIGHSLGF